MINHSPEMESMRAEIACLTEKIRQARALIDEVQELSGSANMLMGQRLLDLELILADGRVRSS